jgi:uncharacterized membrane-anchored protein YhcB (DUF1043 family)
MAWSTTEWAIILLAFLAGIFIGMSFLAGGKWKRRYKEEVRLRKEDERRREEVERERKHREAEMIAARARDDRPVR